MAIRPWITPLEVKSYTEHLAIHKRVDTKLATDISRAEQYIISYTNNDFKDIETAPEAVKTATLLVAECYAFNACLDTKQIKSETLDDYSYTAETRVFDVNTLDLKPLLDEYVKIKSKNNIYMSMRKLSKGIIK